MTSDFARRIGKFAILGIASNGLCYLLFLGLLFAGVSAVASNALCYLFGFTISYVGNRRWTFRSANSHRADLVRFGCAHLVGFSSSVVSMALLVRVMPAPLAQIVTIGISAVVIFIALQLLRFGRSASPQSTRPA